MSLTSTSTSECYRKVTVLTETQYRQMSGDTRSPWSSTGDVGGVTTLMPIIEEQIGTYLGTFLEVTAVEDEEHYIDIQQYFRMGLVKDTRMLIDTFKLRLVPGRTITITFHPLLSTGSTKSSTKAHVVGHKLGRIDAVLCLDGVNFSYYRNDYITVDYWAGYWVSLPYNVLLGIALVTRELARELIVKTGRLMDDDYPHFASVRSISEMGTTRGFAPHEGLSFFGDSATHKYVESILSPYQVNKARGIR